MEARMLLAVDDQADNLFVLEQLVAEHLPECKLVTACCAEEGLALARQEPIWCAVIDMMMPGMDGIEMCRRLKADEKTASIPLILLTAYQTTTHERAAAMDAGSDEFISKPVDGIELCARIRAMLRIKQGEEDRREFNTDLERLVRQRTRELQESEQKYRQLVSTTTDAIMLFDADSKQFLEINKACERLYGYSRDEMLALNHGDITAEPDQSSESIDATIAGQFDSIPLRYHRKKDGTVFPVEISASTFELDGKKVLCGVVRDVTGRLRAEAAIQKNEQQAVAGRMAARVAHEINNPLAAIKNSFLLIRDAVPQDHPYYEMLDLIDGEIHRIARIVRQMLYVYRPQTASPEDFDLYGAVRDICALLAGDCRAREVTIVPEMPQSPIPVHLQKSALYQVLFNLLHNAIEATPKGGTIKLAATVTDGQLELSVTDEGGGIPAEMRARIFEPFYTTKPVTGGAKAGAGLGLPVSLSLVEAMGGTLNVDGANGGAVFRMRLPMTRDECARRPTNGPSLQNPDR